MNPQEKNIRFRTGWTRLLTEWGCWRAVPLQPCRGLGCSWARCTSQGGRSAARWGSAWRTTDGGPPRHPPGWRWRSSASEFRPVSQWEGVGTSIKLTLFLSSPFVFFSPSLTWASASRASERDEKNRCHPRKVGGPSREASIPTDGKGRLSLSPPSPPLRLTETLQFSLDDSQPIVVGQIQVILSLFTCQGRIALQQLILRGLSHGDWTFLLWWNIGRLKINLLTECYLCSKFPT